MVARPQAQRHQGLPATQDRRRGAPEATHPDLSERGRGVRGCPGRYTLPPPPQVFPPPSHTLLLARAPVLAPPPPGSLPDAPGPVDAPAHACSDGSAHRTSMMLLRWPSRWLSRWDRVKAGSRRMAKRSCSQARMSSARLIFLCTMENRTSGNWWAATCEGHCQALPGARGLRPNPACLCGGGPSRLAGPKSLPEPPASGTQGEAHLPHSPENPPEVHPRPQAAQSSHVPALPPAGHLPSRAPAGRSAVASPPWAAWTHAGAGCPPGPGCPGRGQRPRCPGAGWNLSAVRAGGWRWGEYKKLLLAMLQSILIGPESHRAQPT